VLAAVILGSGAAFLESSVVTVALPEIGRDLDLDLGGVQWVMNAYLLALGALIITGGSLGDLYGRRRVFIWGLLGFAATSLLCTLAPTGGALIGARVLQGASAALLVPASLAIVEASFAEEDRGAAIGAWAGWSGISSLLGPFLGGWLVDIGSWRWVFAIVVVAALVAAWLGIRHLPESRAPRSQAARPDWVGSALVSLGLAGLTYALVEAGGAGLDDPVVVAVGAAGCLLLVGFILFEHRASEPMLPLAIFRSRQFSGANAATLANYLAIGAVFFFLSLQLQLVLGYSALEAGAASAPATVIMLLFSPQAGRLGQRFGARIPMTVGPLVLAVGVVLLAGIERGDDYLESVLPGVLVFGVGMTIFVAPLTAAVLGALPDERAGIASAVNNAAARLAQLFASAALPAAAGLSAATAVGPGAFSEGYRRAMLIAAAIAALGGVISWLTIRGREPRRAPRHPSASHACTSCPRGGEGATR
jgi:EmrB/QacA subfamily drug resistance transporter